MAGIMIDNDKQKVGVTMFKLATADGAISSLAARGLR
jgi:hypothetical protein